jgi:hypothetical protein
LTRLVKPITIGSKGGVSKESRKEGVMGYLSWSEKSQTIRYALLTTNVVEVLLSWAGNNELSEEQKAALARGADLIQEIIDGAMLAEGKQFSGNVLPTEESLSAYGYALSTLQTLNVIANIKGFTDYFENLQSRVKNLIVGTEGTAGIEDIKGFFLALNEGLKEDILKDKYLEPMSDWGGIRKTMVYAAPLS